MKREDGLFLNPDEYNKTVIDYAFEFKNFDFLKYLLDNEYIWFADNSENDFSHHIHGFGAGTSVKIKERDRISRTTLPLELERDCEEKGLRQKMIALAIENKAFTLLDTLRAREIPTFYQFCRNTNIQTHCKDYYEEDVIDQIIDSDDGKLFDYFATPVTILDPWEGQHTFIYPFFSDLLEEMIALKNNHSETLLKKAINYNQQTLSQVKEIVQKNFENKKEELYWDHNNPNLTEPALLSEIAVLAMKSLEPFIFDNNLVFFRYYSEPKTAVRFCTNCIHINATSKNPLVNDLIQKVNDLYEAIIHIQPDITLC